MLDYTRICVGKLEANQEGSEPDEVVVKVKFLERNLLTLEEYQILGAVQVIF
jgi:hypothetical protein